MENQEYYQPMKIYQYQDFQMPSYFNMPSQKQYQQQQKNDLNSKLPIIIDYGSFSTKAGWQNSENPDLVFRTVVSKNKDLKNANQPILVGNQLKDFDYSKLNYRSPFENNIIIHFGLLESINDYIFTQLGIQQQTVDHPVILSECFANPQYSRINIIEQFFECYQVPQLMFGVNDMFNLYNCQKQEKNKQNSLVISIGYSATHIFPILNNEIQRKLIRRIQVGTKNQFDLFYKTINLKNSYFKNYLSTDYVYSILQKLSYIPVNYNEQLNYYRYGKSYFQNQSYTNSVQYQNNLEFDNQFLQESIQIQFPKLIIQQSVEEIQRKTEIRKEQGERLKEAIAKKKEQKQQQLNSELKELEQLSQNYSQDKQNYEQIMKSQGINNQEELNEKIKKIKLKLGIIKKEDIQLDKVSYINTPDEQLNSNQLRQKKIQLFHYQSQQTRNYKKQQQEAKRLDLEQQKQDNPELYINSLYEKRDKIIVKINKKKQIKSELGIRNSRANQKRMQKFAQLGGLIKQKRGSNKDEFGLNDDDWNMYRGLNADDISEDENDELQLNELEIELRDLDENFENKTNINKQIPFYIQNFDDKIILNSDLIKCNQIFFQPSIIGNDQAGITETILQILSNYDQQTQDLLLDNIIIIGPGSQILNIDKRIYYDLKQNQPINTVINVNIEKNIKNSTWKGMQSFSQTKNINQYYISQQDYQEYGSDYFKSNPLSNYILY